MKKKKKEKKNFYRLGLGMLRLQRRESKMTWSVFCGSMRRPWMASIKGKLEQVVTPSVSGAVASGEFNLSVHRIASPAVCKVFTGSVTRPLTTPTTDGLAQVACLPISTGKLGGRRFLSGERILSIEISRFTGVQCELAIKSTKVTTMSFIIFFQFQLLFSCLQLEFVCGLSSGSIPLYIHQESFLFTDDIH